MQLTTALSMPKTSKLKVPEGYEKIEPTINKLRQKLREAQTKAIKTENKQSSQWPIYQINHQISKYVYTMYYEKKIISRELYEYLLKQKYVNLLLIAKWKKQGYEKLCCVNCIIREEKNHQSTCICRVPKSQLGEDKAKSLQCITCGCKGCSSTD